MTFRLSILMLALSVAPRSLLAVDDVDGRGPLTISWDQDILTVSAERLPGGQLRVWYLEAYCRPGSTDREWNKTVIGHTTRLVSASEDRKRLRLKCDLNDGVEVDHDIRAEPDGVVFHLTAHNPTDKPSQVHWAQPCIRVDTFTGRSQETYLDKCFVFLDGKLTRMPTPEWATKARYTPGQVWCPSHVDRNDVNPRPLSRHVPTNGLIGCYSADERMILATAWEPYQELFQGVIVCIHSDLRIGGLEPGQTKRVRGKIYLVDADVNRLLERYRREFPEHVATP